ncbi:hypothetical protein [Providencia sp. PROV224]|uniref:hypothetical protein n=1 Tax=Providencia sp. PROV224 TaxID=2936796 RepID=UPI00298F5428|nr:hypothetical protein [Providencia sp. PROV224]
MKAGSPEKDKNPQGVPSRKIRTHPAPEMQKTPHLGWKSKTLDDKDGYLEAHFFPQEFAQVFMSLWRQYLVFRASVECHHPYAFVSFDSRYLGNPYTYNSFNQNYAAGLRRIGLEPDKTVGLDPHGHRHNYGRRLTDAGVDPLIRKKVPASRKPGVSGSLHHALQRESLGSVSQATQQLQLGSDKEKPPASFDWKTLAEHGFEDIDPNGTLRARIHDWQR